MANNRQARVKIAEETTRIVEKGFYQITTTTPSGGKIYDLKDALKKCASNTRVFKPGDSASDVDAATSNSSAQTAVGGISTSETTTTSSSSSLKKFEKVCSIEVTDESTLRAARRLVEEEGAKSGDEKHSSTNKVLCLNFASAKNPGGGFLKGSQAQEESLCRCSALYSSLNQQRIGGHYASNASCGSCYYTDSAIYSPDVPVFRDDSDDSLLVNGPYAVSFLTMPAVNVKVVGRTLGDHSRGFPSSMYGLKQTKKFTGMGDVRRVMFSRAEKLLSLCVRLDYDLLVLGAWGCGVFENDPNDVAAYFKRLLLMPSLCKNNREASSNTGDDNNICRPPTATVETGDNNNNGQNPAAGSGCPASGPFPSSIDDGKYAYCFKRVVFAVMTNHPETDFKLAAFRRAFATQQA